MSRTAKQEQLPVGTGRVIQARKLCSGDIYRVPDGTQVGYCIRVDKVQEMLHTIRLCDLKTREVFDPDEPVIPIPVQGRTVELMKFADEGVQE